MAELAPEPPSFVSQLSEAIAKFLNTSFDDAAKTFIERLQSSEMRAIQDVEVQEVEAAAQPAPPPAPTFNVSLPRNPNFVGRSGNLSQLFGMWKPGQKNRVGIVGLGGIGKTELALEFVYRLRDMSPTMPISWFGAKDLQYDSPAGPPNSLMDWLKEDRSPDCLLVVDADDQFEILQQSIPDHGSLVDKLRAFRGTIIVLARSIQNAHQIVGPRDVLELGDLELEASTILLRENLGTHALCVSEDEIHDVVRLLTCMPRAIIQVANLLNDTGMTVPQFLDMYQQSDALKLRLFGKLDPVSEPDHNVSVVGRGVVDVGQFRARYAEASRILYQLYFLGGTLVPQSIFAASDPLDMIITIRLLKGHCFVIEDVANRRFTLHPLVYLTIRKAIEGERSEADEGDVKQEQKWYEEVVVTFAKQYPDANCEDRSWWKSCFAQLLSGYDSDSEPLRLAVAAIYRKESNFFKRKGLFLQALRMALLARGALPDPIPHEHLDVVHDQVALLDTLAKYRDVQAALQTYPTEHEAGLLWKKRMGARLEDAECANKYNSALELFYQIQTAKESANSPRADISLAIDDYAWALMLKGRYRDAAGECRKALVGRTADLGSSHPDTLTSFHNLAEILRRDGKLEEALRYIQEAIRGRENTLGSDHPDTVHSRTVKGEILLAKAVSLADFDEAETLLVSSTNKLSASLSDLHPIVMTCKSDRALIMVARGKYEAAEQIILAALEDKAQGPWLEPATHPDTLKSKLQLAEVMRLKEGCKAADIMSERSLTETTGVLTNGTLTGDDFHPDQLTSLHHRAIVLSGLGQHLPALQKIDLALTGRKEILGPDHPDVFMSMTWKGEIMRSQLPSYQSQRTQTLDAIDALHKAAYEGFTFLYGPEHHNTLQCLTNMAFARHERGPPAHAAAEELYRQVYRGYLRNLGELHIETLKSKSRLAEAMRVSDKSNHVEAKKMWREACAGFAKVYGVEAYVTLNAYKGYEKFLKMYPDP